MMPSHCISSSTRYISPYENTIQDIPLLLTTCTNMGSYPLFLSRHTHISSYIWRPNASIYILDSWIHNLHTYFNLCIGIIESQCVHIIEFHFEATTLTWCQSHSKLTLSYYFCFPLECIKTWDFFLQDTCNFFYHPRYRTNLLCQCLQLCQVVGILISCRGLMICLIR